MFFLFLGMFWSFSLCFSQNGTEAASASLEFFQLDQNSNHLDNKTEAFSNWNPENQLPFQKSSPKNFREKVKELALVYGLIFLGLWLVILAFYLIFQKSVAGAVFLILLQFALPLLVIAILLLLLAIFLPSTRQHKRHFLFWTW